MKYYNKILLTAASLAVLASCADDGILEFSTEKPASIAQLEYLNDYGVLKSYVDRSANPNFKLGTGVEAGDYNAKSMVYSLVTSNFDEITAGNAMKYNSCVKDNGFMDFGTVESFVKNARNAGISIYGHTLVWHSQQNNKYLNGLIADKEIEVDPDAKLDVEDYVVDYSKNPYTFWNQAPAGVTLGVNASEGCLEIINPTPAEQNYFVQYHTADGIPTIKDQEYKLKMMIRGSDKGRLTFGIGPWSGRADGAFEFDTEWKEYEFAFKAVADGGHVMTQSGLFAGTLQIKYVKITHSEAPAITIPVTVAEYDFEDGNPLAGWGDGLSRTVENGVFVVTNPVAASDWQKQLCHETTTPFVNGTKYFLKLKIKGSVAGSINAGFQNPDGYKGCGNFPAINVTTDWKEVTVQTTCNGDNALRMLFSVGHYAGTLYMDDISIYWEKSANSIPLTPEEKKEVLTAAMERWVKGMLEACDGYVTAWDVVNEPLAGVDKDGDGLYDLQSVKNVSEADAKNNFYWQDYLGDDYVRTAIKLTRQYGPANMKLFINDYNLESDWDDNKKLKSLIKWIERWESDGVTKVDGIGTQMHVSCYMNPTTQASKEKHVVKMFELMAATGKLVKISELDMGLVDANGNTVLTDKVTEAQHKAMSDFYKFIIKKYFEIIPANQRYGITQWAPTDSPSGSGWRAGEPIGLWNINYSRKHTYAGFADGLSNK